MYNMRTTHSAFCTIGKFNTDKLLFLFFYIKRLFIRYLWEVKVYVEWFISLLWLTFLLHMIKHYFTLMEDSNTAQIKSIKEYCFKERGSRLCKNLVSPYSHKNTSTYRNNQSPHSLNLPFSKNLLLRLKPKFIFTITKAHINYITFPKYRSIQATSSFCKLQSKRGIWSTFHSLSGLLCFNASGFRTLIRWYRNSVSSAVHLWREALKKWPLPEGTPAVTPPLISVCVSRGKDGHFLKFSKGLLAL